MLALFNKASVEGFHNRVVLYCTHHGHVKHRSDGRSSAFDTSFPSHVSTVVVVGS